MSNSISHKICDKWISWFLIAQVRTAKGIILSVRNSLTSLDINDVTLIVEDIGAVQASFVNNSIDIDVNSKECVNINVDEIDWLTSRDVPVKNKTIVASERLVETEGQTSRESMRDLIAFVI